MKKWLLAGLLTLGVLAMSGCTVFESFSKSIESDTKGLPRTVKVYSYTGELLSEYEGEKVRVESENEGGKTSILIDGKRISFYNTLVIVEEK